MVGPQGMLGGTFIRNILSPDLTSDYSDKILMIFTSPSILLSSMALESKRERKRDPSTPSATAPCLHRSPCSPCSPCLPQLHLDGNGSLMIMGEKAEAIGIAFSTLHYDTYRESVFYDNGFAKSIRSAFSHGFACSYCLLAY
ncbi:hypothetical protein TCAL_15370 [Tigriopus californicus]|uniref:Uncharacterized protein n=1 Tax=Tigriopus californicus TaxID=6832 RepID=A0A553PKP2_TIGCA|nr:hypothetical protein TCAL_15370 [Tigriopus californicus]